MNRLNDPFVTKCPNGERVVQLQPHYNGIEHNDLGASVSEKALKGINEKHHHRRCRCIEISGGYRRDLIIGDSLEVPDKFNSYICFQGISI